MFGKKYRRAVDEMGKEIERVVYVSKYVSERPNIVV
jgi:hypothetical protein